MAAAPGEALHNRVRSLTNAVRRAPPESVCTALVAGAVLCVYAFYRVRHVGGCDESAYLSESYLLRGLDPGLVGTLSPVRHPALVPLCHELAGDRIVGIFPLGYPALLALFGFVGDESFVNPILGALSTWLMYLAVVPIAGRRVGTALSLIWCTTPLVVWGGGRLMSDLPAATGLLATFVLLSRGRLGWAGAILGATVAIRPTSLLFVAPALMWTSRAEKEARARFWLSLAAAVLAWMALESIVRRSALPSGYLRSNLGNLGPAQALRQAGFFGAVVWNMLWPLVLLAVVGVASRPVQTVALTAWVLSIGLFYALWQTNLEAWWESRFVLPAYPAIFLLAAHGAASIERQAQRKRLVRGLQGVVALAALIAVARNIGFSYRKELATHRYEERYFSDSRRVAELVPKGSLVAALNLSFPLRFYGGLESFDYRQDSVPTLIDAAVAEQRLVYAAIEPWRFEQEQTLRTLRTRYLFLDIAPLTLWANLTLQRLVVEQARPDGRPWTVHLSAAQGMLGDVALASDGRSPPIGSVWNAPGTVRFADKGATLTFVLPQARVVALSMVLDGNDEYELEASSDGARFTRLAIVPGVARFGLQARVVAIPPGAGPFVRLSPFFGDGSYSVAEITPIVEAVATPRAVEDHHP